VFLGEYFHSLDVKGRVVLPSGFRRHLEDGCVVTKGQDGQLAIYSVEEFGKKAGEVTERPQDRGGRQFSRTIFAGADLQTPDKSGRVLLKPELRAYAGVGEASEVVVIGVFDHVELWEKERYLADRASGDAQFKEEVNA
jgi:MraZ protein